MWGGLEKILEHVTSYSTNAGKVWYLLVFIFRLIIVATIGQSVYSDEQSAFRCSTKVIGCDNVCYDKFSKISHIRFWAFQLLAVTAPAVVFHFYSLNVRGRIEKIRGVGSHGAGDDASSVTDNASEYTIEDEMRRAKAARIKKKFLKRTKSVGLYKEKKTFANNNLVNVTLTREIRAAYLLNVFLRIVVESISLYIAYTLFHFADYTVTASYNPFNFIILKVPQVYLCEGHNVEWACGQHLNLGKTPGYIPCWVSRPWEKTIFMCYMNIMSASCCILSVIEFCQLVVRYITNRRQRKKDKITARRKSSRRSEVPTFHSVDEMSDSFRLRTRRPRMSTSVSKYDVKDNVFTYGRELSRSRRPTLPKNNDSQPGIGVPISKKPPQVTIISRKKSTKSRTKKKGTVGITLQDSDDNYSAGSLYHSSEYERSSEEEGDESLNSVSIRSDNGV